MTCKCQRFLGYVKFRKVQLDVLVGGRPTPLKNDGVKVSWDDDIPNIWKNKEMFQTTNQFRYFLGFLLYYPIYYGKVKFMFQSTKQI